MQALLGKDNPYTNLSSMRRALDADKDSFAYKASHNIKDDYAQYKEWTDIVGQENMPKSLAEFQELKYNDNKQYELLSDYKFSVENGRMSPLVKFKDYTHMKQRIEREIVGLTTVDGVEIKSQSKHFIERLFGSVEQRRSGVSLEDIKRCLTEGEIKEIRHTEDGESIVYRLKKICKVSVNASTHNLIQTSPD